MSFIEIGDDASPAIPCPRDTSEVRLGTDARARKRPARQREPRGGDLKLAVEEEMRILTALRADIAVHHETLDDPDLMVVLAEGETSLLELIDLVLELDLFDEALISALKGNRDTLAVRLHRMEERRRSRRVVLEQALNLLERKSLERPTGTISLADRAPNLVVDEESVIPAKFFDLKPVLNRRLAKEALEAGEEVPGARLSDRAITLTLRRR